MSAGAKLEYKKAKISAKQAVVLGLGVYVSLTDHF